MKTCPYIIHMHIKQVDQDRVQDRDKNIIRLQSLYVPSPSISCSNTATTIN